MSEKIELRTSVEFLVKLCFLINIDELFLKLVSELPNLRHLKGTKEQI